VGHDAGDTENDSAGEEAESMHVQAQNSKIKAQKPTKGKIAGRAVFEF
jgi:hypothetical protein